jgi:hypothetical protein
VSVEEARMHLSNQIASRKDITEQLNAAKKKVEQTQKQVYFYITLYSSLDRLNVRQKSLGD